MYNLSTRAMDNAQLVETAALAPRPRQRLIGLDLLRLLAILLVIGRHFPKTPRRFASAWKPFFDTWKQGGWVGVDLFFVLSGFLVSGLLFAEYQRHGRMSIGRFYVRRGWKIYPAFFVFITISFIVVALMGQPARTHEYVSEYLFLQSYIDGLWSHTWSLAVEEHFYILLPLLLLGLLTFNRFSAHPLRPVLWIAGLLAIGCLVGRVLTAHYGGPYQHLKNLFPSHLRLDSLFFGVLIGYLYHADTPRFVNLLRPWRWAMIVAGAGLFVPAFVYELETTPYLYTFGLTQFYLAGGLLMTGVLLCRVPGRFGIALLAVIGADSYSIYLWHRAVNSWGMKWLEQAGLSVRFELWCLIALALAIGWGILMARLIELPALRLRDRWFPSRAAALDASPGSAVELQPENA